MKKKNIRKNMVLIGQMDLKALFYETELFVFAVYCESRAIVPFLFA